MGDANSLKHSMFMEISTKIWAASENLKVGNEVSWKDAIFGYPDEKRRCCPGLSTSTGKRCKKLRAKEHIESARATWEELKVISDGEENDETFDRIKRFISSTHCFTHSALACSMLEVWRRENISRSLLMATTMKDLEYTEVEDTTLSSLDTSTTSYMSGDDSEGSADALDDTKMTSLSIDSQPEALGRHFSQNDKRMAEALDEPSSDSTMDDTSGMHEQVTAEIGKTIRPITYKKVLFQIQVHELAVRNLQDDNAIRDLKQHQILFTVANPWCGPLKTGSTEPDDLHCQQTTGKEEPDEISLFRENLEVPIPRAVNEHLVTEPDSAARKAGRALRAGFEGGKKLFTHGRRRSSEGALDDPGIKKEDQKPKIWANLAHRTKKGFKDVKEGFLEDPHNLANTSSLVEARAGRA